MITGNNEAPGRLTPRRRLVLSNGTAAMLEAALAHAGLLSQLEAIIPSSPPSLIHGDLWRGNVLVAATDGTPALIDPAVS